MYPVHTPAGTIHVNTCPHEIWVVLVTTQTQLRSRRVIMGVVKRVGMDPSIVILRMVDVQLSRLIDTGNKMY